MSHAHDVRDRMTQRLIKAGHTKQDAKQKAVESLKRCDRDSDRRKK